MRKITDFIINKRYLILALFVAFAIVCAVLTQKVVINYDMAEYLPSTSETRIGMDIMEKEFAGTETSSLNLMFKGLEDNKKTDVYNFLNELNGIDTVDYDETENYNKDDYTLYVITVDDDADSELATDIYKQVTEKYEQYDIYTSGDVASRNTPVLEIWIIALAVGCAFIILIIMCESYVEPFLFMITILIAVLLNKGTNIIFDSVSNITESISAILQLALSMDYSIMLMNRYNQEKEQETDNIKAMKNALYHAFKSISSSSLTTIVGLIVLVLMSFTIGRDLGLVLAKGVLFSLISIFFILPGLILIFDKWIVKTKKKTPKINIGILGKMSYKIRFISIPLFLLFFIGSFFLKGNLGILYTSSQEDEVSKIFKENNQMAIIYKNEDEDKIAELLPNLENNDNVDEVLAYSNTINESLDYNELNAKLKDLGSDVDIEEYLLKILYYNYYNKDIQNTMTFNEFVRFIKSEVYNNPNVNEKIDETTRADIDRVENFITEAQINKKRTASEIGKLLEIDEDKVKDILIYYSAKKDNTKITINDFINFINNDVLTDKKYSSNFNASSLASLNTLSKFASKTTIQTKMTADQMASLFSLDTSTVNDLYMYHISVDEIDTKMSLSEFSNFVLNYVLTDPNYASSFNEETINNMKLLSTFSNINTIKTEMNVEQLSSIFGINRNLISQVLLMKYSNSIDLTQVDINDLRCSPYDFVEFIIENSSNENISSNIDATTLYTLNLLSNIMNSSLNNISYSYSELADFIGIENSVTKNIYLLYTLNNTSIKMTPSEFVNFILLHKDDEILSGKLSTSVISNLQLIQTVMNGVLNNTQYNSTELSKMLGIDKEKMELLYGLYNTKHINANRTISLNDFIGFLLSDVVTNKDYSANFDNEKILKLNTVNGIMKASMSGTKYTVNEIMSIISVFTDNVDRNMVELLYMYYGSENNYNSNWELTIEEFVRYLNEDILTDSRFDDYIEDEMRKDITDAKTTIDDAKELLAGESYSRVVINSKFDPESEETFAFIQNVKDLLKDNSIEGYVIGNSPMAYEMSGTFNGELDFITVITMIAIFIVVEITFKSILIPIILVLIIQCAVYMTMGILSFSGQGVYFISILIVQSILMGATIDYAILYTSYYLENRKNMGIKDALVSSYNGSIHTILTSSSILIIVTLIVANFASAIASKICRTISEGTLCSTILILGLLPAILAICDKIIVTDKNKLINRLQHIRKQ